MTGRSVQTGTHRASPAAVSSNGSCQRPRVAGKFLYAGGQKLYLRGVTYGTFRPQPDGTEYPKPELVEHDFFRMSANNLNVIRTYTVPPQWLLDAAGRHGLYVMVGLPWEQHVTFLDDKRRAEDIERRVRDGVRASAGHPAVLCYAIGNEIPASIVRWHGRRRVERFLKRLYDTVKTEDPQALVTYVNYPTTEYLQLPFLDLVCFNVYLESQERLASYLARLQNIAGDRPLIMAEIGLDSRRNGEEVQAHSLGWQIRTVLAAGCAGAFVFAWTDDWHRGGHDIDDWDFGITGRDRRPKPALEAVRKAFVEVPFRSKDLSWPRISVIVCSFNGARTIRDCFEGLLRLEYPDYEVIVVNDGSSDRTAAIAEEYGFRLINTKNGGLSRARNIGLEAATGEIVAYIDDDAYPDVHWLTYLAATFQSTTHVGVGGPNIAPPGDGRIADCAANAPGGPIHVLLSDQEAEHIPGCNMAFRKAALKAVGGFDPQFHTAGDDVDLCWKLQEKGWTLGFSPAAVVWHHRRNSVRAYWKQQRGYGKAEALLEKKWPDKYNGAGHVRWGGRLYNLALTKSLTLRRARIYHGVWGNAPFQSLGEPVPTVLSSLVQMPEWYLGIAMLAGLSALGAVWTPMLFALPLLVLAMGASVAQAVLRAGHATFTSAPGSRLERWGLLGLTVLLHVAQPVARLWGRLSNGLTPWRRNGTSIFSVPWPRTTMIWSERWQAPAERLQSLETVLRKDKLMVCRGGEYDRWDLEIRDGTLGAVRILTAVEEHGAGRQLMRFRVWARCSQLWLSLALVLAALSIGAFLAQAWPAGVILGIGALILGCRMLRDCAVAMAAVLRVLEKPHGQPVGDYDHAWT